MCGNRVSSPAYGSEAGITEREYAYFRVPSGEYTVELVVGDRALTGKALLLKDHWYDK